MLRTLTAVLLSGTLALAACHPPLERYEYTSMIMAAEARLVVYADTEPPARAAAAAAFARMDALDAVMSDYRADSELSRLCARAGAPGGPVPVSDDLHRVLVRGQAIADASGGAFDMTVGPMVRLWRNARRSGRLPDETEAAAALALVGRSHLKVSAKVTAGADPPTVTLELPGMQLDLGGIGKGFAADEAVEVLRRHGVPRCLVDLGGDIAVGEPPPDRPAWRVTVDTGLSSRSGTNAGTAAGTVAATLDLVNAAVATSGDREQFVEIGGTRYSHIIDPRTGTPLTRRIAVVVIAPDATTADALASALSVLGPGPAAADLLARFPGATASIETE